MKNKDKLTMVEFNTIMEDYDIQEEMIGEMDEEICDLSDGILFTVLEIEKYIQLDTGYLNKEISRLEDASDEFMKGRIQALEDVLEIIEGNTGCTLRKEGEE
jgi:hypothetical protein